VAEGSGAVVPHDAAFVARGFDDALARLVEELPRGKDAGDADTLRAARVASEEMIRNGWFNPI
jgi:hypothetical protein